MSSTRGPGGGYACAGAGVAGAAGFPEQHSARAAEPLPGKASGGHEDSAGGEGSGAWQGSSYDPAARHEEARIKFEESVAPKLMRVLEKRKLDDLKVATPYPGSRGRLSLEAGCFRGWGGGVNSRREWSWEGCSRDRRARIDVGS